MERAEDCAGRIPGRGPRSALQCPAHRDGRTVVGGRLRSSVRLELGSPGRDRLHHCREPTGSYASGPDAPVWSNWTCFRWCGSDAVSSTRSAALLHQRPTPSRDRCRLPEGLPARDRSVGAAAVLGAHRDQLAGCESLGGSLSRRAPQAQSAPPTARRRPCCRAPRSAARRPGCSPGCGHRHTPCPSLPAGGA